MPPKPPIPSTFSNVLGYQSTQAVLRRYGLETLQLDNLLRVMGVENSLERLLTILDSFNQIASLTENILDDKTKWVKVAGKISLVHTTALVITENKSAFRRHLRKPEIVERDRNSVLKLLIKYGPLYATLGYAPIDPTDNKKLHLLKAQILCQHLYTQQKNVSGYMEKLFKGALKAARTLATSEHLKQYPSTPSSPDEYFDYLATLPEHSQRNDFLEFLKKTRELTSTISLEELSTSVAEQEQKDKLEHLYGNPDISEEDRKFIDSQEEDRLDKSDTERLAEPSGLIFTIPLKPLTNPAEIKKDTLARIAKSRAMENQLFHFAWSVLNPNEIRELTEFIFTESEKVSLTSRVALGIMLFCGFDSNRIVALHYSNESNPEPCQETYIVPRRDLRILSHGPIYKTPLSIQTLNQAVPKQSHIDLPIPEKLADLISILPIPSGQQKLFSLSADSINRQCSSALSILKNKGLKRLTLHRIQNYLYRRLAMQSENDLAGACLTLGAEKYLARTRIHYASFDESTLGAFYKKACKELLIESGSKSTTEEPFPNEISAHVGTPVRPALETVQSLISNIKNHLQQPPPSEDFQRHLIDWHNAYALYVTTFIAYTTGFRANNSPYITAEMYDEISGFCVIADKTSKDMYHARLVWLTEACCKQLELYRAHVQNIYTLTERSQDPIPGIDGEFFFLSEDGRRQTATRKRIIEHLRRFGYHLPPNTQRHLLKSELQENGCPSEIIEALLGHWHVGEEPWTKTSGLHPIDYKTALAQHLSTLTRRLGLTPCKGLAIPKKQSSRIALSLHVPTNREKEVHRKKRTRRPRIDPFFQDNPVHIAWIGLCGKVFTNGPDPQFPPGKKEEATVLKKLFALLPALYRGEANVPVDQAKLQTLIKRLKPNTKPANPRAYYRRMNYLIRILEWGKENLGWHVDIPPRPTIQPHGYNLARPSLIRHMKTFRTVESAFLLDIKQSMDKDPQHALGQILLSAILYGNLLHQTWTEAFLRGLTSSVYIHNHLLWVDLWTTPIDAVEDTERYYRQRNPTLYRRWVADPTTQVLLLRLLQKLENNPENLPKASLTFIFSEYQRTVEETTKAKLPPLGEVLRAARAFSILTKPPFLAAYGSNQVMSSNLPDPAWIRLLTQKALPSKKRSGGRRNNLITADSTEELKRQKRFVKEIRTRLIQGATTGKSQGEVAEEIDQYLMRQEEHLAQCTYLLGAWASSLLRKLQAEQEKRQAQAEAITTAETYIRCFCDEYLVEAIGVELDELTTEEFCSLIDKIISKIQSKRQKEDWDATKRIKWICQRLNLFLVHISLFHNVPCVIVEFQGGNIRTHAGHEVRSNYISPQEYRGLLRKLGWGRDNLSRQERMTLVAAILGYRSGVRPAESWGALVGDFIGDETLELLIQPNDHRQLKSSAALRRLPLYTLLPKDELKEVRAFLQFRKAELGTTADSPLFTIDPYDTKPIPRQSLFTPIKTALYELLEDQTLVIYSLRHSFTCNILLQLLLRQVIPKEIRLEFLCHQDFEELRCAQLRKDLLENESLGRKVLFAVATLLGHSDTSTLLRSYFHFSDFLLWHYSNMLESLTHINAEVLMSLSECSRSVAYERRKSPHPLIYSIVNFSENSSATLAHPLIKDTSTRKVKTYIPSRKALTPLDQILHGQVNRPLPKGLNWPKNRTEYQVLKDIYTRVEKNIGNLEFTLHETAGALLTGYRYYDGTFEISNLACGSQALDLLKIMGLGTDQIVLRHSPSRWSHSDKNTSRAEWEQVLGCQLIQGRKLCGKNIEHGSVQVDAMEIFALGKIVSFDKRLSNILAICLYLLANQAPATSPHSAGVRVRS